MDTIRFDLTRAGNAFKPLNCTNGGPWGRKAVHDQYRTNFDDYQAARIPYSRNHDSAACAVYGGPYSHDISCIFPDFDADENDPASYDFACTDDSILMTLEAGTETFFRLGQTIEHQVLKHHVHPPKDFAKWARICEHIIRHYNEGWGSGYRLNIRYWEIWNEPDLRDDPGIHNETWTGTREQFFDLYETTAKHLKKCFPSLRIGGPSLARSVDYAAAFLSEMEKRNVPMDFFSWHIYAGNPEKLTVKAGKYRALLDAHGYEKTESILNEYNFVNDWQFGYVRCLKAIHSLKGASFFLSCMCAAQPSVIDMLMYYDTRPSVFNGIFDFYTYEKLKGYYPMKWYGAFYEDGMREIPADKLPEHIYALCGRGKNGKTRTVLTYYTEEDGAPEKAIRLDFGKTAEYEVFLLDETHDAQHMGTVRELAFTLKPYTCLQIIEK